MMFFVLCSVFLLDLVGFNLLSLCAAVTPFSPLGMHTCDLILLIDKALHYIFFFFPWLNKQAVLRDK